jgi:List-Bact-rpt repeat protein
LFVTKPTASPTSRRPAPSPGRRCTITSSCCRSGFHAAAGTKYWVQIYAYQNALPDWDLAAGLNGDGGYLRCISAAADKFYQHMSGDCAWALLDQATAPVTISVSASPASGETVSGGGTYTPGTSITVATPASGPDFINWTEAGAIVSTAASYTFNADGPRALVDSFTAGGGGR